MRTTITIDDALLDEVRRHATERGQSIGELIEDSMREALLRHRPDTGVPAQRTR